MRLALILFWSAVALLCASICVGVIAAEQGRWFLVACHAVMAGWNIWLMGFQRRILDGLDE